MTLRFSLLAVAGTLLCGAASAHIRLSDPPARTPSLKVAPCGVLDSKRGTTITTYEPGETITVKWTETIGHPGYYRISFDDDGQDDFVEPKGFGDLNTAPSVLVDDIADKPPSQGQDYEQKITFPDIECDNCTLQVIQVMTDKPPYAPSAPEGNGNDVYHQCADLVLKRGAHPVDAGTDAGKDAAKPDPKPSTDETKESSSSDSGASDGGGCSVARTPSPAGFAAGLCAVGIALLALERRRKR